MVAAVEAVAGSCHYLPRQLPMFMVTAVTQLESDLAAKKC